MGETTATRFWWMGCGAIPDGRVNTFRPRVEDIDEGPLPWLGEAHVLADA